MNPDQRELIAGLRILSLVARADGVLREEERVAIDHALRSMRTLGSGEGLPDSVEELLAGDYDMGVEEEFLRSDEARLRVHDSAFMVAYADGNASVEELALLERIRPPEGEDTLLGQVIGETKDTLLPGALAPIYDQDRRKGEVREDVLKYAILCAALGAIPLPVVGVLTDVAVVGLQMKMVRDVGNYFGHDLDKAAVRSLIGTMAGSVTMRVALNNLARFVPGWGSVFGATTSFASTMAMGEVAYAYFEAGGVRTPEELRAQYDAALGKGRERYAEHADTVAATRAAHEAEVARLAAEVRAGRMTQGEYEQKITALKE